MHSINAIYNFQFNHTLCNSEINFFKANMKYQIKLNFNSIHFQDDRSLCPTLPTDLTQFKHESILTEIDFLLICFFHKNPNILSTEINQEYLYISHTEISNKFFINKTKFNQLQKPLSSWPDFQIDGPFYKSP